MGQGPTLDVGDRVTDAPTKHTDRYVVECYAPGIDEAAVEAAAARARCAVATLTGQGRALDYVKAVFIPDDEVVFHIFAALDPAAVQEASVLAELRFERVVRAVSLERATAEPRSTAASTSG